MIREKPGSRFAYTTFPSHRGLLMTSRPGASERSTGLSARLRSVVPALRWLRGYDRGWLRGDVVAGITLAAYLLPAGLGDASLANLPPEAGLYACLFCGPGLLAVLQLAAHRDHRHLRDLAAGRRVARRDRGRRPVALRRAGGRRRRCWWRSSRSSPGWSKAGAIVNFISESVMIGLQVRRGAVPRQHAAAEAVRLPRRARRFLGEQRRTSSGTWTKPIRPSLAIGGAALAVLVLGQDLPQEQAGGAVRRGRRHRRLVGCSASTRAA